MQHRAIALLVAPLLLGIGGLTAPAAVQAQAVTPRRAPPLFAVQLESLSRARVRQWAATRPRIECAPAPLTERPTAGAEFARPKVMPLEAAFLDATVVKRTLAAGDGLRGSS